MKFPRYWAKGKTTLDLDAMHPHSHRHMNDFACWGWSDISTEDARRKGTERADAVAIRVLEGAIGNKYLYGNKPFREPVLDQWTESDGTRLAVVSRNSYGCAVLNTADVMFVDIDLVIPGEGPIQGLKRLFGRGGPMPRQKAEDAALAVLREMAAGDRYFGARVYRTFGGLRYLMTHRRMDPTAEATHELMRRLGADPLYIQLCRTQECFRARLTPKPWRCGMDPLRVIYPWNDAAAEAAAQSWVEKYTNAAAGYATCSLVTEIGTDAPRDPEIVRVVDYHDRATGVGSERRLA